MLASLLPRTAFQPSRARLLLWRRYVIRWCRVATREAASLVNLVYLSLSLLALANVVTVIAFVRLYSRLDREWRERERKLVDQLLTSNGQKPLIRIEREHVVKLPDPETPPLNELDRAFFDSEIVEEIEHARGLTPQSLTVGEARAQYPDDWITWERRLRERKIALRV